MKRHKLIIICVIIIIIVSISLLYFFKNPEYYSNKLIELNKSSNLIQNESKSNFSKDVKQTEPAENLSEEKNIAVDGSLNSVNATRNDSLNINVLNEKNEKPSTFVDGTYMHIISVSVKDSPENLSCREVIKLNKDKGAEYSLDGGVVKFDLNYLYVSSNEVSLKLNDEKNVVFSSSEYVELIFDDNNYLAFNVNLMRDNDLILCIYTNKTYDVAYCESLESAQRFLCFDNLGYMYGLDYCENIDVPEYKDACEGGALGLNG